MSGLAEHMAQLYPFLLLNLSDSKVRAWKAPGLVRSGLRQMG